MLRSLHDETIVNEETANGEELSQNYDNAQAALNNAEGERLSIDELAEVYYQTRGTQRARKNMSLSTKTKTGEINDYLEMRRPYGAAAQWRDAWDTQNTVTLLYADKGRQEGIYTKQLKDTNEGTDKHSI